jgi:hypothetical protein
VKTAVPASSLEGAVAVLWRTQEQGAAGWRLVTVFIFAYHGSLLAALSQGGRLSCGEGVLFCRGRGQRERERRDEFS